MAVAAAAPAASLTAAHRQPPSPGSASPSPSPLLGKTNLFLPLHTSSSHLSLNTSPLAVPLISLRRRSAALQACLGCHPETEVVYSRDMDLSSRFGFLTVRNLPEAKKTVEFDRKSVVVHAAYTRRSRAEREKKPNRKSWRQRTDMYMRPFLLNVFFSKRFIHAKVVHRGTSKVISVASTNAKDLRNTLPCLTDSNACRTIGELIAKRSKDADVFALAYEARKNERIEGKLGIVIDTIMENGIIFV